MVAPGVMIAAVVGVLLVIGVIAWVMHARNAPLEGPADTLSGPAPERNIPRPGMVPGGQPR